ncbi:MAG: FAD-dependent oxidoreductase, partial [Planctomycetota bacterium]
MATESVHSLVIGAGISGLAAALTLKSTDHSVLVLEQSERAGGWIRTEAEQGYRLEWGPHSLPYSQVSALQLAEKLDLSGAWIPAQPQARYRYLYINGR